MRWHDPRQVPPLQLPLIQSNASQPRPDRSGFSLFGATSVQPNTRTHPLLGPTLAIILALVATAIGYSPAITGGFQFDDQANLAGLTKVVDLGSALAFVFSGFAGPLGRPLSLATFAAQASSWPTNPSDFLYVNICIHLINGALVAWNVYLLGVLRKFELERSAWIAASTASLWMQLPLLASSSLLVVQRMTTLSATVMLLALVAYLKAREGIQHKPGRSVAWMTAAVVIGSTLAALAKENGILLPTYILAIEALWLEPPSRISSRRWKSWTAGFLIAPSACIAIYLIAQLPYSDATIVARGFTGLDRLASQSIILGEYIKNAFIPNPKALGPFHDSWLDEHQALTALCALATALLICVSAIAIRFRQSYPSLLFGLAWFASGHLLESTTVPLELYFEHRNYLPIIGPVFSLSNLLAPLSNQRHRSLVSIGLAAYALVLGLSLYLQCSLWGNPRLAAEIWSLSNPHSIRATLYLMSEIERSREQINLSHIAEDFLSRNPNAEMVRLQKVVYDCMTGDADSHDFRKEAFLPPPYGVNYSNWASAIPEKLYSLQQSHLCGRVTDNDISTLAEALLSTPQIIASANAVHNLHSILAVIAINNNNIQSADLHVRTALAASFSLDTFEVALLLATHNGDKGRIDELVTDALKHAPVNRFRRKYWSERVREIAQRANVTDMDR